MENTDSEIKDNVTSRVLLVTLGHFTHHHALTVIEAAIVQICSVCVSVCLSVCVCMHCVRYHSQVAVPTAW